MNFGRYEFTDETRVIDGVTVHRIRATADFNDVKRGDLGGFVESDDNLNGDLGCKCWVYDNACVYGRAFVDGDAVVKDNAIVYDDAIISSRSKVMGNAKVHGYSRLLDRAVVKDDADVFGYSQLYDDVVIGDHLKLAGGSVFNNYINILKFS